MTHFLGLFAALCLSLLASHGYASTVEFPRLLGMNIGEKHYHDPAYQQELARLDIVVLGFYRGWGGKPEAMREVVRSLKQRNPKILVGQYGVMNELRDVANDQALADARWKVGNAGWWLKNATGKRVQWTSQYDAWEINFTELAPPDEDGKRYPQWLAERDYRVYYQPVPEFDFWYADNVMFRPRVRADWDGDGVDDDPNSPRILKAWREGYVAWWARMRALTPDKWIMGNADSTLAEPEFRGQLEAVFLEGLMGKPWSIGTWQGWHGVLSRYRGAMSNLREPRIVGFNVAGRADDYRFFRLAYTTCLLDDGYFSYTDERRGYSSVPWFDEYDVKLGRALTEPPRKAWRKGVWRRDFEHGVVLVNPGLLAVEVEIEPGLVRVAGQQDSKVNNGQPVAGKLRIGPRDGIVLVRGGG